MATRKMSFHCYRSDTWCNKLLSTCMLKNQLIESLFLTEKSNNCNIYRLPWQQGKWVSMVTEVIHYATSCYLLVCSITCWLGHYFLPKCQIIAIFSGFHGNKENEFPWLQRWHIMQQVVIYMYAQELVDWVIISYRKVK